MCRLNNKPHPIDFKNLKAPLLEVVQELNVSMPNLVRTAVKEYLKQHYREKLKAVSFMQL